LNTTAVGYHPKSLTPL